MSFWYYTSFPSSRTTFGILGGIRYSFWTISHFIFLTPLQIQEGTPLEIPRWSCFFNTWFSDGSTSLLLLFRAFVMSHPYVPWSLFNSSWVTLHFPLASMSFTYLVLLSFDLQLFFFNLFICPWKYFCRAIDHSPWNAFSCCQVNLISILWAREVFSPPLFAFMSYFGVSHTILSTSC